MRYRYCVLALVPSIHHYRSSDYMILLSVLQCLISRSRDRIGKGVRVGTSTKELSSVGLALVSDRWEQGAWEWYVICQGFVKLVDVG